MLAERHIHRSVIVAAAIALFAAPHQAAPEVSTQRPAGRGPLGGEPQGADAKNVESAT
jgi:hypothetical protein